MNLTVLPGTQLSISREGDLLAVGLRGTWSLRTGLPSAADLDRALDASPPPRRVRVEGGAIERWDSGLVVVLGRIWKACEDRGIELDLAGAPPGARRLLEMARGTVAPLVGPGEASRPTLVGSLAVWVREAPPLTEVIGSWAIGWGRSLGDKLAFLGSTTLALGRTLLGRTRRLGLGFTVALQEAGVGTLPILALIAFASGGVLSLLATQQLDKLGGSLLAPNLVAIVILRELGALTTGVALAGRLGSVNAAELATMVVGEEVDALRVIGVDPFDLLVAPRVLALVLMGPLLVLYANALGLLGSLFVGVGLMDVPAAHYVERTSAAITLKHAIAGLVKGAAFGFVVGMAGCYYGLRSGKSPGAVGKAVQAAVVTAVLGVVVADTVLTLFFMRVRL
jgi:phospholipid/cholesterol/gamma-HCH transport system permease protein